MVRMKYSSKRFEGLVLVRMCVSPEFDEHFDVRGGQANISLLRSTM